VEVGDVREYLLFKVGWYDVGVPTGDLESKSFGSPQQSKAFGYDFF
jgi:hypothetical protein